MTETDAAELYRALLSSGRLSTLRRLTYRCRAGGCLLLDAVDTPLGIVMHQTRYKYSPEENARRSNAEGRAKNTEDGDRHWRPRTYFLAVSALRFADDPVSGYGSEVTCDHVLGHLLTAPRFQRDWDAGGGVILI